MAVLQARKFASGVVLSCICFVSAAGLALHGPIGSSPSLADEPTGGGVAKPTGHDRYFENSIGMKLRRIRAGTFAMGSPQSEKHRREHETLREVTIQRSFYLAVTEVTQGQWLRVMTSKPWLERAYTRDQSEGPVTCVSWSQAAAFCGKLSRREKLTYRLPTEAEWEFACRAGATTAFCYGDDADQLIDYGWIGANTFDAGEMYAHQVAQKKPNRLGLFDMHGNAWEWCADHFYSPPLKATAPVSARKSALQQQRVIRGGSWHGVAALCRSASRFRRPPDAQLNDLGFRVVLEIAAPQGSP